ncbi:hypothetical protein FF38_13583, partial [Lucilia cuprina]
EKTEDAADLGEILVLWEFKCLVKDEPYDANSKEFSGIGNLPNNNRETKLRADDEADNPVPSNLTPHSANLNLSNGSGCLGLEIAKL